MSFRAQPEGSFCPRISRRDPSRVGARVQASVSSTDAAASEGLWSASLAGLPLRQRRKIQPSSNPSENEVKAHAEITSLVVMTKPPLPPGPKARKPPSEKSRLSVKSSPSDLHAPLGFSGYCQPVEDANQWTPSGFCLKPCWIPKPFAGQAAKWARGTYRGLQNTVTAQEGRGLKPTPFRSTVTLICNSP